MNNPYGLLTLALLVAAVSGCMTRAPDPSDRSAGSLPPPMRAPRAPTPAPAVAWPAAPIPARLVAASPGAAGATDGVGGTPASDGSAASDGSGGSGGSGASSQCLEQIETFAESHSGNRVMLGQAAFAGSDQLVLTRMPRRGVDGRPLDGRAAAPQPIVLNLLAGPAGCLVRMAQESAAAAPDGTGAAGVGAGAGAGGTSGEPPASTPLPACTCLPLAR